MNADKKSEGTTAPRAPSSKPTEGGPWADPTGQMQQARPCRAALLLALAALLPAPPPAGAQVAAEIERIDPPLSGFYSKRADACGVTILAHASVSDAAVEEAARRLTRMLGRAPGIAASLHRLGAQMHVIGKDQQASDLPMYRHMKGKRSAGEKLTFDQRGRGYGGLFASCCEENLLLLRSDRYWEHRDICTHEFAHTVLAFGLSRDLRRKVERQYRASLAAGRWKTAYAATNPHEFFAELTMWYFGSRGDYGRITPRPSRGALWLRSYDSDAYTLLDAIYSGRLKPKPIEVVTLRRRPAREEGKLRSRSEQTATEVIFVNHTTGPVRRYWLDEKGRRKDYGVVPPGGVASQSTFATHPWLLTASDGKVLGIYVTEEKVGRVVIEEPKPPATRPADGR